LIPLYNLGSVPWIDSQLLYHALPRLGRSGLFLLAPQTPYVCIGFHQDAAQEVDLRTCAERKIPVFRREVGGGAVYLDGQQIFFQLVISKEHPLLQVTRETFYQRALEPALETLRSLGLDPRYKPVNDILINNHKITGSGAAEIDNYVVFVGNILLDFDYSTMADVLKVPDAKFRDKLHLSLKNNLTTLRCELKNPPSTTEVYHLLEKNFSVLLGGLEPCVVDDALRIKARQLEQEMLSEDWLLRRGKLQPVRTLQVRSDVELVEGLHKAAGGLIRAILEIDRTDKRILSVGFSGDFFIHPPEGIKWLEDALYMCLSENALASIQEVYDMQKIETPGVQPEDWLLASGIQY
jgi:lipoate---protein ligase